MLQVIEIFPHSSSTANDMIADGLGSHLLTWFNFNPSMDK